jgi:hypothetical protein
VNSEVDGTPVTAAEVPAQTMTNTTTASTEEVDKW